MATTASVTFTNTFEDGLTGNITINNVQVDGLDDLKQKIKDFNAQIESSDFPKRLVSSTGAYWKRISGCKINVTERTYFF